MGNLFTGYHFHVLDQLQVTLPQEDEIYRTLICARLKSDKIAITLTEKRVADNKIVCDSKLKKSFIISIAVPIAKATTDTFEPIGRTTDMTIPITTWEY